MVRVSAIRWALVAVSLLMLLMLTPGCHKRGVLVLTDGSRVVGHFAGGDAVRIRVHRAPGATSWVARDVVERIVWPGTALSIFGGSLVGAGVITLTAGAAFLATDEFGSSDTGVVTMSVAGVIIVSGLVPLLAGVATMQEAMDAVDGSVTRPPEVSLAPWLTVGRQSQSAGAQLGVRW